MSYRHSQLILLCCIFQTIHSQFIQSSLNAQQLKPNVFVDNIGVLTVNNVPSNSSHRQLIDNTACSTPPYTSSCTNTNPNNCPCASFSTTEKQQILDAHNNRRDLAASGNEKCASATGSETKCPSATNMNYLFWDNGLETISTYWAHQCVWGHHQNEISGEPMEMYQFQCDSNNCLAVGYNGNAIGENLAASGIGSTTADWNMDAVLNGVKNWFDESKLYHYDDRTSFGVTGHWTQGVWAKTRYIGCGYAACQGNGPFSPSINNWFNLVCKYYPAGNYPTQPYESGSKCSACDSDRNGCTSSPSTDYNSLCGGGQCRECAADFGQNSCGYNHTSCPSSLLCNDGIDRSLNCDATISSKTSELWDHNSENALIAGIGGSFLAFIILLNAIGYIIYYIIKKNGNIDTEISQSSSMVATISGNKLLFFILSAFICFLSACISFIFIKSNVVLGSEYNPLDSCEIGWFLEYFGYEWGKFMISMFLVYRMYSAFDNSMYSIPKRHIMHIFFKFVPFLFILYLILILFGFLLNNQFDIIISINKLYLYCGSDDISIVFVFGHIISFIRELTFNSIILYWIIYRLWHMNKTAKDIKYEGRYTAKKIKKLQKQMHKNTDSTEPSTEITIDTENVKSEVIETKTVKTTAKIPKLYKKRTPKTVKMKTKKKVINLKLSKKDIIWNAYIKKYGNEPGSTPQLQQWAKSGKLGTNATHFTYKQAKEMFNEYRGKGIIGVDKEEEEPVEIVMESEGDNNEQCEGGMNEEGVINDTNKMSMCSIDIKTDYEYETESVKMKRKKMKKDKKFNMQNRRGLIIKWVMLIVIMFLSSFVCQILLCIRKYPTFYIYYDIIIQCICCILFLWISKGMWSKIVEIFNKICLCNVCCPVLIKQM